jgi:hypothetical protein
MNNKRQTPQLNILAVMGSLFILSLNALGTIAWINLYATGRYTDWWVFGLMIICGITSIVWSVKFYKQVRGWLL